MLTLLTAAVVWVAGSMTLCLRRRRVPGRWAAVGEDEAEAWAGGMRRGDSDAGDESSAGEYGADGIDDDAARPHGEMHCRDASEPR